MIAFFRCFAVRPLLAVALGALALPAAHAAAEIANSTLGPMVARLAEKTQPAARDWSEFAHETVRWGQRLQASQQPVPAGPVHDALAAADLGEKLDPHVADWPKLRSELQSLLEKPADQQPQQQKKSDQQKDDPSKQDQPQQKQPPKNHSQKPESDEDRSSPNPQQNQPKQNEDQPSSSDQSSQKKSSPDQSSPADAAKSDEKKNAGKKGQSAFGDLQQPPPSLDQHPGDTQTVGGARENKEEAKTPSDPALAIPLQKLDQLRSQDSPVRLFQLMEGDNKSAPAKTGKNW
ncbi:hypothetical protein K0B96_11115 [Horticoccus luteus]|uniref:Uncharacterized protein n=1 Tax=Horticoccus luteus TaxID=2862869 RepID=A0A8F9TU79_9BACT|nr:hypothetical protein [Horticoccus luteus]QYM77868.1 hypothetical protein K0B96_11115 [Horticoccus luteus]